MKTIVYSATAAVLLTLTAITTHGSTTATEQPTLTEQSPSAEVQQPIENTTSPAIEATESISSPTPPPTAENPSQPVLSPEQTGNLPTSLARDNQVGLTSAQTTQVVSPKDVLVPLPPPVSPGTSGKTYIEPPSLFTNVKPQQISPYAPEVVNTQLPTLPITTPDIAGSNRAASSLLDSAISRYEAEQKKAEAERLAAVERERLAAAEQAILKLRREQTEKEAVIIILALLVGSLLLFQLGRRLHKNNSERKIVTESVPPREGLMTQKAKDSFAMGGVGKSLLSRLLALTIAGLSFVAPKLPRLISKVRPEHFRQKPQVESVRPDLCATTLQLDCKPRK